MGCDEAVNAVRTLCKEIGYLRVVTIAAALYNNMVTHNENAIDPKPLNIDPIPPPLD